MVIVVGIVLHIAQFFLEKNKSAHGCEENRTARNHGIYCHRRQISRSDKLQQIRNRTDNRHDYYTQPQTQRLRFRPYGRVFDQIVFFHRAPHGVNYCKQQYRFQLINRQKTVAVNSLRAVRLNIRNNAGVERFVRSEATE